MRFPKSTALTYTEYVCCITLPIFVCYQTKLWRKDSSFKWISQECVLKYYLTGNMINYPLVHKFPCHLWHNEDCIIPFLRGQMLLHNFFALIRTLSVFFSDRVTVCTSCADPEMFSGGGGFQGIFSIILLWELDKFEFDTATDSSKTPHVCQIIFLIIIQVSVDE